MKKKLPETRHLIDVLATIGGYAGGQALGGLLQMGAISKFFFSCTTASAAREISGYMLDQLTGEGEEDI